MHVCLPVRGKSSHLVETDGFLTSVAHSMHSKDSSVHVISQRFQLIFVWTIIGRPTCSCVCVCVCVCMCVCVFYGYRSASQ
jgi:hypothetical protein